MLNAPLKLHANKQEGNPATIKLPLAVFNLWIFTLSFIEQEDCYWEKELQLVQKGRKISLWTSPVLHYGCDGRQGKPDTTAFIQKIRKYSE